MPFIRPALVSIFSAGLDPWDTLVKWCTLNAIALTHTSIIVIDREGGRTRARQLVYSTRRERPFGYIPKCGGRGCNSLPGDVVGTREDSDGPKGVHARIRLFCKRCRCHRWVDRPDWITHAHPFRPHYFVTPWPLTEGQISIAQGSDKEWSRINEDAGQEEIEGDEEGIEGDEDDPSDAEVMPSQHQASGSTSRKRRKRNDRKKGKGGSLG